MGKTKPVFKFKKLWFDEKRVQRMMTRKERKALNRYGGIVRKHAQFSMKSRKKKSKAGEPPSAHVKTLKRLLFYSYDPGTKSTVVGPVLLERTQNQRVPRTHEEGGVITVKNEKHQIEVLNYPPRPYMLPAHQKHVGKIAQWYAEA